MAFRRRLTSASSSGVMTGLRLFSAWFPPPPFTTFLKPSSRGPNLRRSFSSGPTIKMTSVPPPKTTRSSSEVGDGEISAGVTPESGEEVVQELQTTEFPNMEFYAVDRSQFGVATLKRNGFGRYQVCNNKVSEYQHAVSGPTTKSIIADYKRAVSDYASKLGPEYVSQLNATGVIRIRMTPEAERINADFDRSILEYRARPKFLSKVKVFGRGGYEMKFDENSVCVKLDVPGIPKEELKVWMKDDTYLKVKGEYEGKSFSKSMDLSWDSDLKVEETEVHLKVEETEAHLENGVLTVMIPMTQNYHREKRKYLYNIQIN